jgi:hypothetical protein
MKLYVVFDIGGQGMRDNGALGVFDEKEKALKSVGNDSWYPIVEIDSNTIYPDGISHEGI